MKRYVLLSLSLVLAFGFTCKSQISKPGQTQAKKTRVKTPAGPKTFSGGSQILVVMEVGGTLYVDYERIWNFDSGDTWKSEIIAGTHILELRDADVSIWNKEVVCKRGEQTIVKASSKGDLSNESFGSNENSNLPGESDYLKGEEFFWKSDFNKALINLTRAAAENHPAALYRIGRMYQRGYGVKLDSEKATEYYERAYELGYSKAGFRLGRHYYFGWGGFDKDEQKGREMSVANESGLERLAELGDVESMMLLGDMYSALFNNNEDAQEWYVKSLATQWPYAKAVIGHKYIQGSHGYRQNIEEGLSLLKSACQDGYPDACATLGGFYQKGQNVTKDLQEALRLNMIAASSGYVFGVSGVGNCYYDLEDYQEAAIWYEKAAQLNHSGSANRLGYMYSNGKGVTKDEKLGFSYFMESANAGYAWGMFNTALGYEQGKGVVKDLREAKKWYQKAADLGHERSAKKLVELYQLH